MTSSARSVVVLALALAAGPAAAQTVVPEPAVPEALAARVAQAVGDAWAADAAGIVLEWGRRTGGPLETDTPFKLLGRGDDGWFVVTFSPAGAHAEAVRLRAGVRDSIPVAARAVRAGARLVPEDIVLAARHAWGPPARHVRPGPGWEVRRALAAGDPLTGSAVVPPSVVNAGDPVRFVWARGGVSVAVEGVALNAARIGEPVRGRVEGRTGPLNGIVTGPREARLMDGGSA